MSIENKTTIKMERMENVKNLKPILMSPQRFKPKIKQYSFENASEVSESPTTTSNSIEDVPRKVGELKKSESGIEMNDLLKMIDNEVSKNSIIYNSNKFKEEIERHDNGDCIETTNFEQILKAQHETPSNGDYNKNIQENCQSSRQKVILSEVLYVPVKKYPKYNFVGRILGPRGMTVKQLERETGCKIYVRGRASSLAFNPHTKILRGGVIANKSLSTISQFSLTDDPLHVYIESHDYEPVASQKLAKAVKIINELLSPPADGRDELKRQQLVDISLINGTYRQTQATATAINRHHPRHSDSSSTQSIDPTSSPAEEIVDKTTIDKISRGRMPTIYRIPQQKRTWQKVRELDENTEDFAKSASSREYVSNFVNQTKEQSVRAVRGDENNATESEIALSPLSPSTISRSLKIVRKLLESHKSMPLAPIPGDLFEEEQSHRNRSDENVAHLMNQQLPPPPLATPMPYMFPFVPPQFAQIPPHPNDGSFLFTPTPPTFGLQPPPPPPPPPSLHQFYGGDPSGAPVGPSGVYYMVPGCYNFMEPQQHQQYY